MTGESISRAEGVQALNDGRLPREAELILRAQKRLPDAWSQIYHENYDRVFRYTFGRTGHRETAEDLAAAVFLEALRSIGGYRHAGRPLLAWLYTIARNVVNQYHRRRLRGGPAHVALESVGESGVAAENPMSADALDLRDAVARLPESQREVVLLHYYVGLTIPEIARLLGRRERAVYSLHTRAIQGIRWRLDGSGKKSREKGE